MCSTVQRFSSERTGRVKYSTSCPWRRDSPSAASRAIPFSLGEEFGSRGREAMGTHIFAICSPIAREEKRAVKVLQRGGKKRTPERPPGKLRRVEFLLG